MIDKQKQKIRDRLNLEIAEYLKRGGKITQLNPGETIISGRKLLNPDTRKDYGEDNADLDSEE